MNNKDALELNFDVWLLIADLHHKMILIRDKELSQYDITPRQMHILRLIDVLGTNARLSIIAKATDRKLDVISKQAATMEKAGMIKRIIVKPKSRLLRLELTKAGHDLLKISRYSDGMNEVLSILTKEEIHQLDNVLNRLLVKINNYNHENNTKRLF
jgi:DNA-binding MarR family transcriptional regulator